MASPALCAALEHEPAYPAETIDCLMQEADMDEDKAVSMFEDVIGDRLHAAWSPHWRSARRCRTWWRFGRRAPASR